MANLITLSEYKIAKKISGLSDDDRLTAIIDSVSQLVKTYCNNSFVDYYSGYGKQEDFSIRYGENFIQLSEFPVVTIRDVYERDNISESFSAANSLVEDQDYYLDKTVDSIYRIDSRGNLTAFKSGTNTIRVVYNAGYSDTPADLKLAVIDLVAYYHKDEHKARQTIAGASIQNQGSTSQRNNVAFPDHIKRVLDLYKNF